MLLQMEKMDHFHEDVFLIKYKNNVVLHSFAQLAKPYSLTEGKLVKKFRRTLERFSLDTWIFPHGFVESSQMLGGQRLAIFFNGKIKHP